MVKVAVTGGIGSGKSYVCKLLEMRGISIYDCDKAAKHIMASSEDIQSELKRVVGSDVFSDGKLNKAKLASFLLKTESNTLKINNIIHPAVAEDFIKSGYGWMECAILFSSGFNRLVDKVICVVAPIDVRIGRIMMRDGISVLCAPGHKGLYGPQGSGFAAFADDFDFERFRCSLFGGNGKNSNETDMGHEPPDSYEAGTVATPSIVGLGAGLRYVVSVGRDKIEQHENSLMQYGKELLKDNKRVTVYMPQAQRGAILLLGFEGISPSEVSEKLGDAGVCTRAGLHCAPTAHRVLNTGGDALRVSFSAFNTPEEVEKFVLILDRML